MGKQVAQEKKTGRLSDELVEACAEMVRQRWNPHPEPTWVCCVPSLRHLDLVPDFARRLAAKLGLPLLMPLKSRGQSTAENAAKPFSPVSKSRRGVCDYPSFDAGSGVAG